jgi:transporter family-2 protein
MRETSSATPATASLVLPAIAVGALCGAFVAAQGQLNGDLSTAGAGALVASWLSYLGTLATVVVVVVVTGSLPRTALVLRRDARWWWFGIGTLGIPIVLAMTAGVPIVGIAIASVCSVAGQTVSGLALDARGVGLPEPLGLSGRRVLAGAVAVAGLGVAVLSGSGGLDADLATVVAVGLLLFAGGVALGGQQAGNGKVTALAGDPVVAGLTTAAGGSLAVTAIVAVVAATGGLEGVTLPGAAYWPLYLGGPLGAAITVGAAWAVRHLGTFALTLAIVGGQMVTAIAIDVVAGVGVQWATLLAASMIIAATVTAVGRAR